MTSKQTETVTLEELLAEIINNQRRLEREQARLQKQLLELMPIEESGASH